MEDIKIPAIVIPKRKLEKDWLVSDYLPVQGETVVYDIEIDADGKMLEDVLPDGRLIPYTYERFKVGDGVHTVNELPFLSHFNGEIQEFKVFEEDNLFNPNSVISGRFTGPTGGGSNLASWSWFDLAVEQGIEYIFSGGRIMTCFHDLTPEEVNNKAYANIDPKQTNFCQIFEGGQDGSNYSLFPPEEATYVRVSVQEANKEKIVIKKVGKYYKTIQHQTVKYEVTTAEELRSTLESIVQQDGTNYEVYIKEGTYDLRDAYTSEEVSNHIFKGLFVPPNCRLIGASREKTTLEWNWKAGDSYDIENETTLNDLYNRVSTLNTYCDSSELENLTIKGTETRYALHDDFIYDDSKDHNRSNRPLRTFRNCTFLGSFTVGQAGAAYGGGYRGGCQWKFENCKFQNEGVSKAACYIHNHMSTTIPAHIVFDKCEFVSDKEVHKPQQPIIRITSLNNNVATNHLISFYQCSADNPIILTEDSTTTGTGLHVCIDGYGNNFDGANVQVNATLSEGRRHADYVNLAARTPRNFTHATRLMVMAPVDSTTGKVLESFRYPSDYDQYYIGGAIKPDGTGSDGMSKLEVGPNGVLQNKEFKSIYYPKRIIVGDPDYGIVMKGNRDIKDSEELFTHHPTIKGYHYDKYFNYMDHDEPANFVKNADNDWEEDESKGHFTIAARDSLGRFIAEADSNKGAYYVVNNKQLRTELAPINTDISLIKQDILNIKGEGEGQESTISLFSLKGLIDDNTEKLNEVEGLAKGATEARVYDNYRKMIDALNEISSQAAKDNWKVGYHILIQTVEVPDLWVSGILDSEQGYEYTNDQDIINKLRNDGTIQAGPFVLSQLETQKVYLDDYYRPDKNATVITTKNFNEHLGNANLDLGTNLTNLLGEWYYRKTDGSNSNPDGVILTSNLDQEVKGEIINNSSLIRTELDKLYIKQNSIAHAYQYFSYERMIYFLNQKNENTARDWKPGSQILITQSGVPDLWVSEIATSYQSYNYIDDQEILDNLHEYKKIQVGYFILSPLEALDLTCVKISDLDTTVANKIITASSSIRTNLDGLYYRKKDSNNNNNPDSVMLTTDFDTFLAQATPAENSTLVTTLKNYIGEANNALTSLYINSTSYNYNEKLRYKYEFKASADASTVLATLQLDDLYNKVEGNTSKLIGVETLIARINSAIAQYSGGD